MIEIKGKFNTAICYAKQVEDEAVEQIRRMCDYDFCEGSKIRIMNNDGSIASEYTVIVPSDVDGNGEITASDARKALRTSAGLEDLTDVYKSISTVCISVFVCDFNI